MNRFQIQNEMVMPSCYVSWIYYGITHTHGIFCQENFEFKWVNTPFFQNIFPVAGKTREMSNFCNLLYTSCL